MKKVRLTVTESRCRGGYCKAEETLDGIELQVNARNASAIRMYESCGFACKSIHMELPEEKDESDKTVFQ